MPGPTPSNNNWAEVTPKLLAQGLMQLRANCIMPRLVNRNFDTIAQEQGESVNVPIPASTNVYDVEPGKNSADTEGKTPTKVAIPLDQWKEAAFFLTDKEEKEVMAGTIPMQAQSAINAIADHVDTYILGFYKGVSASTGTAGTAPFADRTLTVDGQEKKFPGTHDATQAGMLLNQAKAPKGQRRCVIDPAAEASALTLRAFLDVSFNGEKFGIVEGDINRKLGFDWFMDQNVPEHIVTGITTPTETDGAHAAGDTVITTDAAIRPQNGDLIKIGGGNTYAVKSVSGTNITLYTALTEDFATGTSVELIGSHRANLAFQRDAIAFATRPLADVGNGFGSMISTQVDPVSGLALRLEITREHKRTRYSFDILFGGALVRPELAARILG